MFRLIAGLMLGALTLSAAADTRTSASVPPAATAATLYGFTGPGSWRAIEFCDSRCDNAATYASAGAYGSYNWYLDSGRGPLNWANAFLNGALNVDRSSAPLSPYKSAPYAYKVISGGSGYSSNVTATNSGCTGASPGAVSVSNGQVTAVALGTVGTGCTFPVGNLTITDNGGSGSGATVQVEANSGGQYGESGDTTALWSNRCSDVASSKFNIILTRIGTNDPPASVSPATSIANIKSCTKTLLAAGKLVILQTNAPRGTGNETAAQQKQLYQIDQGIRAFVRQYAAESGVSSNLMLLDTAWLETNGASATGDGWTGCLFDNLHPGTGCAMIEGYALAKMLSQRLGIPMDAYGRRSNPSLTNLYDASNNPYGYSNAHPFMDGTAGTASAPVTGTVATDYTISRSSGSGSTTATASIESAGSSADGFTGPRQVLTVSTGSGTSTENYKIVTAHGLATWNLAQGDIVVGEIQMEVSGMTKGNFIDCNIKFLDNGSATIGLSEFGGQQGDVMPASTALGGLTTSMPLHIRLHPIAVPANVNTVQLACSLGVDASGGAASAGFTWKISQMGIRHAYPGETG